MGWWGTVGDDRGWQISAKNVRNQQKMVGEAGRSWGTTEADGKQPVTLEDDTMSSVLILVHDRGTAML